jgi:hypothetical protein
MPNVVNPECRYAECRGAVLIKLNSESTLATLKGNQQNLQNFHFFKHFKIENYPR